MQGVIFSNVFCFEQQFVNIFDYVAYDKNRQVIGNHTKARKVKDLIYACKVSKRVYHFTERYNIITDGLREKILLFEIQRRQKGCLKIYL